MTVQLLHHSPLWVASHAIRTCWQSHDKSDTMVHSSEGVIKQYDAIGDKDKELIERVGNKFKHSSTLEHIVYSFDIEDISRAVLQELARHRIASPSVRSSRYTLSKDLREEKSFISS